MDYRGYRGDDFKLPAPLARRRYLLQPLGVLMMAAVIVLSFLAVLRWIQFTFLLFFGLYFMFWFGWIFFTVGASYNTDVDKSE